MPRDIASLFLSSLRTTTQLVETPKWSFLKNRSQCRGVVIMYCNGLSYDAIMNTGAGVANANDCAWSEKVCNAVMQPIRRGTCFANGDRVESAPVWVPNQNNRLEMDFFFRTESTRLLNRNAQQKQSEEKKAQRNLALMECAKAVASGKLDTSQKSMDEASRKRSRSPPPNAGAAGVENAEGEAAKDAATLMQDDAIMSQYAITLPRDEHTFRELQFTLSPPVDDDPSEWVLLPPQATVSDTQQGASQKKVYAFDCEMVQIAHGVSALARMTLVNAISEEVVVDMLVKPTVPIVDYVTRFSGITEAMLQEVKATLPDAQKVLLKYLTEDAYVVGHSLENDFKACKMIPRCHVLDTAHLFPHPGGPPYKNALRFLANHYLKCNIQSGEHDSVEDALVCARLLGLKLKFGPQFGTSSRINVMGLVPPTLDNDPVAPNPNVSQTVVISKPVPAARRIEIGLIDDGTNLRVISATSASHITSIVCNSDDDAARKGEKFLQRKSRDAHNSTFGLWIQLKECCMNVAVAAGSEEEKQELDKVSEMNQRVMRVVSACPDQTLVLVLAANCKPDNGNRFSKAHGILYAFIKDPKGRAPVSADQQGCAQS